MSLATFEDLPIEALTEVAKEKFEEAVWAAEKALAKQLEFGRVMSIVKSKLPHGQWSKWVLETFEDRMSLRNIQCHMKAANAIAQNPALLDCADSLDSILELTAVPKQGRVTVSKPAPDPAESPDVIEAESRPVDRNPRESNPRSNRAPRRTEVEEFDFGSRRERDKSYILEIAGDYHAAKKTQEFIELLDEISESMRAVMP
jgi:hypothetical protein